MIALHIGKQIQAKQLKEAQRTRPAWVSLLNARDKHAFRFINQTQQKEKHQQRGAWQWKWGKKTAKN